MSAGHVAVVAVAVSALFALCLLASAAPTTSSGYIAKVTNPTDTVNTAPYFTCAGAYAADRANSIFQYPLNETITLLGAADVGTALGLNAGTYRGAFATSTAPPLACSRDTGGAYVLNGSTSYVTSNLTSANPQIFSIEVWFKATVAGGKLIGLGNSTGTSTMYDRHLYIDSNGKLVFGTYNGAVQVVTSPNVISLNVWHHAVGTMSVASGGMKLYLDGALVASNPAYTVAETTTGYWHIGYDNLAGWPNPPANFSFTGQMRWAAAYSVVLTPTQVQTHFLAGQ